MDLSWAMERMWIDEVLHLHSLWALANRSSTPQLNRLSVANTTSFKREERRRRKALKKQQQQPLPRKKGMDLSPAMERMWIDEVLHLHSLWRIGPPRHNSTAIDRRLSVANTTSFKREVRRRRKALKKQQQQPLPLLQERERQQQQQGNAIPWPFCQPSSIDEVRRWDEVSSNEGGHPAAIPKPLSDEERVEVAALQAQKDCLKLCTDFFSKQCSSDDDEGMMEEGTEEGEEEELVDSGGEIYFRFFMGIFQKDRDLRAYYEQNSEKGKFFCLVCEGIREKVGRKFKDCVSLVQHSISIVKTKRKEAHRSFSRAVCHILGWNSERLPSVVLDVCDLHGQSLVKASDYSQQESGQGDAFRDLNKEHEADIVVDSREVLLELP